MTTTTSGVTFAHAAATLAGHMAGHALPEPVSLSVTTSYRHSTVTAQLRGTTVPGVATGLIAWADTLSVVTVEAWWPSERDRVHLSIRGTLTGSAGTVELVVFGSVEYDQLRFGDLQADKCPSAANPSPTIDALVLEAPRVAR
jgi:hypothetical protein